MVLSKAKRTLTLGYITVFLDIMGYYLIVPVLPYLSASFNATPFQEGILFSGYSIMQMFSLLIMGNYSDIYGRKLFLLLSLFGSCFGSLFQGLSKTVWQLIFWRAVTGLFAGSQIVTQALIADCTTIAERNKYLALIEAFISAASVLGPAIGGVLGQKDYSYPLYFAAGVAGVALIFAAVFLDESNKEAQDIYDIRRNAKGKSKEEQEEAKRQIKEKIDSICKRRKAINVKPTKLMILCFIFEFCNRWVTNAIDSRYGFFLKDKFGVNAFWYAIITCAQSALLCIQQATLYSFVVYKLDVPIPILALCGTTCEFICYFFMGFTKTLAANIVASTFLWVGFVFAVPTSSSIISTTNEPEVQGKVLSWNNFCSQMSLIVSPLILSAIYAKTWEGTYYASMIFAFGAMLMMILILQMPGAKRYGKVSNTELPVTKPDDNVELKPIQKDNTLDVKGDKQSITIVPTQDITEETIVPTESSTEQTTAPAENKTEETVAL